MYIITGKLVKWIPAKLTQSSNRSTYISVYSGLKILLHCVISIEWVKSVSDERIYTTRKALLRCCLKPKKTKHFLRASYRHICFIEK